MTPTERRNGIRGHADHRNAKHAVTPPPRQRRDGQRRHTEDHRDHRRRPERPVQAHEQAAQAGVGDRVTRDPHDVVETAPQPEVAGVAW